MNRREFLRNTVATVSLPYFIPSGVLAAPGRLGANDRAKVGFIGCGGRSRQLMNMERISDHGDIVALADCFKPQTESAAKQLANGDKVHLYGSYAEMLDKEKLDVVFIPTTTHARVLICIHAMQAGLDVYAEKPISLTIQEGQILRQAVKHYKRVLQVGTQQRSIPINAWASKLVRDGKFGTIKEVIACNFIGPSTWKRKPAEPMPAGLDWEQWCNQTALRPYHHELQHSWSRWSDYDDGGVSWGVSGWGAHAFDQVQCALGTDDTTPVEIWPEEKDAEGQMKVTMRYANGTLLKCHGPRRHPELDDLGAIFIGDKGRIEIVRGDVKTDRTELLKDAPPRADSNIPGEVVPHVANFFDCVRSRKLPAANINVAHRASTICHTISVCRDLNRKLHWDPKAEQFINDDEANKFLSRPRRKGFELPDEKTFSA